MFNWFSGYLHNRQQFVKINNSISNYKRITCGVPQGSIIEPLLFIPYINDLYKALNETHCILFDDDTNVFLKHKDAIHQTS